MTRLTVLAVLSLLLIAAPVMAAEAAAATPEKTESSGFLLLQDKGAGLLGAPIGVGLVLIGGAAGIGRIGVSAAESMARQPEVVGQINGVALITAAMVEGATLFAVVVCLLAVVL